MKKIIGLFLMFLGFTLQAAPLVVDDFENGTSYSSIGGAWMDFEDGYSEITTFFNEAPGYDGSDYCMKMEISLKPGVPFPYGASMTSLTPDLSPVDLSAYEGVRFYAKGTGFWDVGINLTETIAELNSFDFRIQLTEEWSLYEIPFSSFSQFFGKVQYWNPKTAVGVSFIHHNSLTPDQVLFLDSLEFYGSAPADPCEADVNLDGVTDIVDAFSIARHILGIPMEPFDFQAADVSGNGVIEINDALMVARYAAGLSPLPGCDNTPRPDDMPRLGRGMNLGNRFNAPYEGAWGAVMEEWLFDVIADGGFDSVRIPVRWNAHTGSEAPFTIDSTFFDRVDWAIELALERGLNVVVNIHSYDELYLDPYGEKQKFLSIWRQLSDHYAGYSDDRIIFEVLNEPNTLLTPLIWNEFLAEAVDIIRQNNPEKWIMVESANWGGPHGLNALVLPDDPRLILSFHYYQPMEFTHQGAIWVNGSDQWLGTHWGTAEQKDRLLHDFDYVARWAREHNNIPVYLGEFGVINTVPMDDRVEWTAFAINAAEERGFSWGYWELTEAFTAYDENGWNRLYAEALMQ